MPPLTPKVVKSLTTDIDNLIKGITDISETSVNFPICQKFVISNFLYHHHLDVIAPDGWKKAKNLHQKLFIQAQNSHARTFSVLVEKLRSTCQPSNEDSIASVLFLLMKISQGTSSLCLFHTPLKLESLIGKNQFKDLALPIFSPLNEPLPVQEFSSSDEDFDFLNDEVEQENLNSQLSDSGFEQTPDVEERPLLSSTPEPTYNYIANGFQARHWLTEHVLNGESSCIEESTLVIEILWMLQGLKKLSYFDYGFTTFNLLDFVRLSHLDHESLNNFVKSFCYTSSCVVHLQDFIYSVIKTKYKVWHYQSKVYEAFACSLSLVLQNILKPLQVIEKDIHENKKDITLISMEEKLQNCFSYIFLLFNLYEDGIANVDEKMSKRQRVAHLITTLGRKLEETAFTEFDQFKLNILLTLLIETCKPYIEFIDQVIKGNLKDPFEEFIIERNRSLNSEDEFFWENVLILHEVDDYFLFKSLLNHVLSAGKSVEILGKLRLIDEYQSEKNEKNLYNVYVENLFQSLSIKTKHKNIPNPKTMHSEDLQNFNLWMSKITKPNTLLNINFKKFLINDDDDHEEYDEPIPAKVIDILDAEFESTKPLSVVLINCLIPHVVERCRSSNQKALQVLVDDYDLLEHLDLVRAFYLLENGDAMFDFCSRIFKKLLRGKIWENSFGLNSYLEEVVESGGFTKFSQKLKISIIKPEKETNITCFLLNELQRIKLDYDVPWPVNIVLNKECIVTFQKIFVFLLQIKCAKYALDNLKFSENCKTNKNQHLLHMMRMKLLCTINSIHSYFMIRILHTTRLKLRQEILQATNVKELVDVHQIYMQTLLEMCFLMPHLNYIKNGVLRIMSLSLEFVKYWNVDLSDERMFMLYEMEKRYNKITKYFSILMRMAQKKGECLNSTFLALDFITSNTELNVFPNSYETCD